MSRFSLFVESERGVGAGIDFTDPSGPLAGYYLRVGQLAGIAVICSLFAFLNLARLGHTDVWAHTRYGEYIVQNRGLPDHDPFCAFSSPDPDLLDYAWGSQVLFALTYRIGATLAGGDELHQLVGGTDNLRFLHTVLITLSVAFVYVTLLRNSGSSALAAVGIGFVIFAASGSLTILRPQVFSELAFTALIMVLARTTISLMVVAIVPVILVFWANVHGSYPLGFITLGVIWLGQVLACLRKPPQVISGKSDPNVRRLTLTLVL